MQAPSKTLHPPGPVFVDSLQACVDGIIARVGKCLCVATPLGLGKPNHLLNALYRRALADPSLQLHIYTALTLSRPQPDNALSRRLMAPLLKRVFGNYPELDHERDRRADRLPDNVRVFEFFLQPGQYLDVACAQRDHISTNYTYVARDLADRGVNVLLVQVAHRGASEAPGTQPDWLSLSCNADLTLELAERLEGRQNVVRVAQTNGELPFMYGDAELPPSFFDLVLHDPALDYTLFGTPREEVSDADACIGLLASTLIRDGGELQIGIGSLGDALAYALCMRHQHNATYRRALAALDHDARVGPTLTQLGGRGPFERGLFGATEMLVDAYRHLWQAGILTRRVYDDAVLQRLLNEGVIDERVDVGMLTVLRERGAIGGRVDTATLRYLQRWGILRPDVRLLQTGRLRMPDGAEVDADLDDEQTLDALRRGGMGRHLRGGACLHAGFVLGPPALYAFLRQLPEPERARIRMRSIGRINQLYGHERLDRLHRIHARFLNTAMMVTLCGAVVSDGLSDGRVVSGVGGQYNFVAMAHALPDGRSIIQLRATRHSHGELVSNIVPDYGHTTIARHQRDLVVTEYGVADLRGKTDEEVIIALLKVADSRFQPELQRVAKQRGKLAPDYELPQAYRRNLPGVIGAALQPLRRDGLFPRYPFGSELTDVEQALADALKWLQAQTHAPRQLARTLATAALRGKPRDALQPYLKRMGLSQPSGLYERTLARLLTVALEETRATH